MEADQNCGPITGSAKEQRRKAAEWLTYVLKALLGCRVSTPEELAQTLREFAKYIEEKTDGPDFKDIPSNGIVRRTGIADQAKQVQ